VGITSLGVFFSKKLIQQQKKSIFHVGVKLYIWQYVINWINRAIDVDMDAVVLETFRQKRRYFTSAMCYGFRTVIWILSTEPCDAYSTSWRVKRSSTSAWQKRSKNSSMYRICIEPHINLDHLQVSETCNCSPRISWFLGVFLQRFFFVPNILFRPNIQPIIFVRILGR
jgi:hypothetical protein